jgi:LysM repeat protein
MFDNDKEYLKATQHAQVNTYIDVMDKKNNFLLFIWNLLLFITLIILLYLGYNYVNKEGIFSKNTSVMGISHTKSDNEYIEMLSQMDVDDLSGIKDTAQLNEALKSVVNSSTIEDDSLYTQAVASELEEDKYHPNSFVVLVQKGDTLASISEKYYGDSMAFEKIIEANDNLNRESKVIYVGQKLNIPY